MTLTPADLDGLRALLRAAGDPELDWREGSTHLRMVPMPTGAPAAPPPVPQAPPAAPVLRAPAPGFFRPVAQAGTAFSSGQVVAQLQAGAALWPVTADCSGRVAAVLASDGELVGYGAPLLELSDID